MKKWMIFVLGLVTGFVVALLIDYLGDKKDTEPQKEKVEAKKWGNFFSELLSQGYRLGR